MNSRDRRESLDPMDRLIRESLQAETADLLPRTEVRRHLLQRAARQQRRLAWRLPMSLPSRFKSTPAGYLPPENQLLYLEGLFGLRLGWFSYSQLMR